MMGRWWSPEFGHSALGIALCLVFFLTTLTILSGVHRPREYKEIDLLFVSSKTATSGRLSRKDLKVFVIGDLIFSKNSLILDWIVTASLPICVSMSYTVCSLWTASCSLAVGKDHTLADLFLVFSVEYFWIKEMSSCQMQWWAAIFGRSRAGLYVAQILCLVENPRLRC
jgi:hypothetical protein